MGCGGVGGVGAEMVFVVVAANYSDLNSLNTDMSNRRHSIHRPDNQPFRKEQLVLLMPG